LGTFHYRKHPTVSSEEAINKRYAPGTNSLAAYQGSGAFVIAIAAQLVDAVTNGSAGDSIILAENPLGLPPLHKRSAPFASLHRCSFMHAEPP
jgi:hypothetical protein